VVAVAEREREVRERDERKGLADHLMGRV